MGDVALVSQSGALGGAVLSWAEEQGVGFSKFVSYGNGADLTDVDFLDYLREDDETKVVALYLETVSNGRAFLEAARRLTAVKPLVVIKSGRSAAGGRATLSHTGSLAGSAAIMVRAHNGLAWAALFNSQPYDSDAFLAELDRALWKAVEGVTAWPRGDLF